MEPAWDALYRRGAPYHGPAGGPPFGGLLGAGARVLDLGCGAGKSLRGLRDAGPGWRIVGLDASPAALAHARLLAPVARGHAAALPFRDGAFAAVRVHHLLAHLGPAGRAAAAREAVRVLQPGGFLEAREFARGDLRDGAGAARGDAFVRGGIATHYFAPGELAALFEGVHGAERVRERAVRFSTRPRRVAELRGARG